MRKRKREKSKEEGGRIENQAWRLLLMERASEGIMEYEKEEVKIEDRC